MSKNNFLSDFEPHIVRDWEKIALHELGNKNPWENLTNEKPQLGLPVKPYYDSANSVMEKKIFISTSPNWHNTPKVLVRDGNKANAEALTHLNSGADGIWFDVQSQTVKMEELLRNIELPYCSLFFSSENNSAQLINGLTSFIDKKSMRGEINGAFFSTKFRPNTLQLRGWKKFRAQGVVVKENKNIVDEIVDSLLTTVDTITRLTSESFSIEESFRSIAFSISVNEDFFSSIAKIRALKNLWFTLQEAYQIKNPVPPFVHINSKKWINESYQPHGNMLKQTTAAMAASIAGCNALTIDPEDFENKMTSRIARNVSSILREESHLSIIRDPLAGSFYVDSLTHQIAQEAWKKFQQHA